MSTFFSWQHAVRSSKLESTTKLICYTIWSHMASDGTGCFPSYSLIADESGLSRRCVIEHVQKAVQAGFIAVDNRTRENGSATSNMYRPTMPVGGEPAALGGERGSLGGGEPAAPPEDTTLSNSTINAPYKSPNTKVPRNANTRTSYEKQFGEYPAACPNSFWTAAAQQGTNGNDIDQHWAEFSEWHVAKGSVWAGEKGWKLSWLKWCRNASNRSRGYRASSKPSGGLAAAFGSSVAARYGISSTGSGVCGGQTAGEAGTDGTREFDSEGRRIIPF